MVLFRQLEQGMQQVRNYYNSEAQMIRSTFPRAFISERYNYSFSKPRSKVESKLVAAKKHSEAEKRRRMRINSQYDILRNVLPKLINDGKCDPSHKAETQCQTLKLSSSINETNRVKTDKASVLAETVRQVKELNDKVSKLEVPSWEDKLDCEQCNHEEGLVKATLSCEDRPGLMSTIAGVLGSVKAKVVKADMVTVAGRTRCVLWLQGLGAGKESVRMLRRTLKVVMHKPVSKMRRFTQ